MPLENDVLLRIEELKEAGHEYRYRDQIMVQEFSLSVLATGVLLGAIAARPATNLGFVIQCFGLGFLCVLTLHLRNTNQDRRAALARKDAILRSLDFQQVHQNVDQRSLCQRSKDNGLVCPLCRYRLGNLDSHRSSSPHISPHLN
jgi:hypothetical protein